MCNRYVKTTLYVLSTIAMLLGGILFVMYEKSAPTTWNELAVETTCEINDTTIIQHMCLFPCECSIVNCYTCQKLCYDMILLLTYLNPNSTYTSTNVEVAVNSFDIASLNSSYIVGSPLTCYYNKDYWWNVRLNLESLNKDFLVGAIVLWVLGGATLTVLLVVDILICLRC